MGKNNRKKAIDQFAKLLLFLCLLNFGSDSKAVPPEGWQRQVVREGGWPLPKKLENLPETNHGEEKVASRSITKRYLEISSDIFDVFPEYVALKPGLLKVVEKDVRVLRAKAIYHNNIRFGFSVIFEEIQYNPEPNGGYVAIGWAHFAYFLDMDGDGQYETRSQVGDGPPIPPWVLKDRSEVPIP